MENGNYDVDRYWTSREKVKEARKRADNLPEEIRGECLSIIAQAVEGTSESYQEIYEPNNNPINCGSLTDRETDKLLLKDLTRFFK